MKRFAGKVLCAALGFAALVVSLAMAPGSAQALDMLDGKLQLHGFGYEAFVLNSNNRWMDTDSKGSFNFNNFGLVLSAQPLENTTIWAQLFAGNESSVRLDWAFVDFKLSDQFRIRGGQIRDPIGLLSEIRDVKYLQLSTILPYIYQDETEMMQESFRGASVIFDEDIPGGDISLELCGGQALFFEGEGAEERNNHLAGARLAWETPLKGLSLIGSFTTSDEERFETGESGRQYLYLGSVSYKNYNLDLKGEYAFIKDISTYRFGYYAQAGYTFFDKLTPFVRYDYITTDKTNRSDPADYQKGIALGIDYKINSNIAFKVEDHIIRGYALPAHREIPGGEDTEVIPGEGSKHWNVFAASLNFVF